MCKQKNDLVNKQDMAEVLFQEQDPYIFWRARHKELCGPVLILAGAVCYIWDFF